MKTKKSSSKHIAWEAPEFEYYPKSKTWFIVAGAIAALIALWGILTKNYLFVLIVFLGFFSIVSYGLKKPKMKKFSITSEGVKIGQTTYDFDNLKSFWIFYYPPIVKELSLRSKKSFMPYIKIPLGDQDPSQVKKVLEDYLPEKKHPESLIDNLARMVGF